MKNTTRRKFIKTMSTLGAGAGLHHISAQSNDTKSNNDPEKTIRNYKGTMKYREVGNTGIQVSAFSIGTGKVSRHILDAGLDMGINLLHVSTKYMNGASIKIVGEALKGKTDRVHLALKDNFTTIEEALKLLGVNSVDFIMFSRHSAKRLHKELPEIKKKFFAWRKKGLVKYAGITSHKQMAACIDVAIEAGFFSCVMPTFGQTQFTKLKPQRDALRKKNMSIIAMKTKGQTNNHAYPAQIQRVLSDSCVCTINKGVSNLEDLKGWSAAAIVAKTGFWQRRLQENYAEQVPYRGCTLCGLCEEACPNGVAVADVVRCIRYYHDAEKTPDVAAAEFNDMQLSSSIEKCKACGKCEEACPQNIAVRHELSRARSQWV